MPEAARKKYLKKPVALAMLIIAMISLLAGMAFENNRQQQLTDSLASGATSTTGRVNLASLGTLPAPVVRYLRHVLSDGQPLIKTVRMQQLGELRTGTDSDSWSAFTASQFVVPAAPGFIWNAKVALPLATHVRVLDSYIRGTGAGRVSLLSAIPIAAESDIAELNAGALHRYLAEAVWYPTALLPGSGVFWRPVDEYTAIATLTDRGITVSLEFRFNNDNEVIAIYSSGRFGRFDGGYRLKPWEGHFRHYFLQDGMRIPRYGEVGWYEGDKLELVWKGRLETVEYTFTSL